MRRALVALLCGVALALAADLRVEAWGFDIHRFIAERAIAQFPAQIRPFYEKHRVFLIEHSIDPDLWRSAGFEEEPPRHFVDLDAYGTWPFAALPRDREAAFEKFGREKVEQNGTLPWRIDEMYGLLVKAYGQHRDGTSPYALDNAKFFSAVLAHYVADASVPFHAAVNYDGQLTNQHGIHGRFETELFLRYRDRLRLDPPRIEPVQAPVDFTFDTLIAGFTHVDALLKADLQALGRSDTYDDAYFDRYFELTRPVLERQLGLAISGVAAVITGAWEKAGRPALPVDPPRAIRKKRTTSSQ